MNEQTTLADYDFGAFMEHLTAIVGHLPWPATAVLLGAIIIREQGRADWQGLPERRTNRSPWL